MSAIENTMPSPLQPTKPQAPSGPLAEQNRTEALRKTAREFEAAFIGEMLAYAGFEKALSGDSGLGGETFSRMLVDSYAQSIADAGGFGLADKIYNQLRDNVE
jgi:peptidoglycan hydrolase FlgJ